MDIIEKYDKVANSACLNIKRVNKVLSYCEIESKLAKKEQEEQLQKIFDINSKDIFIKDRSSEYYDLQNISKMLTTLDSTGRLQDRQKRKPHYGSVNSLASDDNNRDYMTELKNLFKEMREILGGVENTTIEISDDQAILENLTIKNNRFFELIFTLQRIAREMAQIASTDNIPSARFSLSSIDGEFIRQLQKLDKVLDNMQLLETNKNPIANFKRKGNIKLEYIRIINSILETIENNP